MVTLRQYLRQRQITQEAFARLTGIPQSLISRFCAGRALPTLQRAAEIERATDGEVPMSSWVRPPAGSGDDRTMPDKHNACGPPSRPPHAETVNAEDGA